MRPKRPKRGAAESFVRQLKIVRHARRLGLTTYRWNNNIKSILLLAAFPFLLSGAAGRDFLRLRPVHGRLSGPVTAPSTRFSSLAFSPVLGTGGPADLAVSAIVAWWPIVFGIAAIWVLIGYFFNDAIIHMATGAKAVTRQEQPKLYNLLENLCISRGMGCRNSTSSTPM